MRQWQGKKQNANGADLFGCEFGLLQRVHSKLQYLM